MKLNRLHDHELLALVDFLRQQRVTIEKEGPTYRTIAEQARDALQFDVTEQNCRRACKAIGLRMFNRHTTTGSLIRQANQQLEAVVRKLCQKLGEDYDSLAK